MSQPTSTHRWSSTGPAELGVDIEAGRIEIRCGEQEEVTVEVRHDPRAGDWLDGISELISVLGATGGGPDVRDMTIRATDIRWSEPGRRLQVRGPETLPLRLIPLLVTISAPIGSRATLRTGSGPVTVTGSLGGLTVRTGSGDVQADRVDGDLAVTTGSGSLRIGAVTGRTDAKTGSGGVSMGTVEGAAQVRAGSGDVSFGTVREDLQVRTGSGELTIADAERGELTLGTGSGDLRVGVHAGVSAELDLKSASGRAHSELEVSRTAPATASALMIRGRTGSGDVLVTRAVTQPASGDT